MVLEISAVVIIVLLVCLLVEAARATHLLEEIRDHSQATGTAVADLTNAVIDKESE